MTFYPRGSMAQAGIAAFVVVAIPLVGACNTSRPRWHYGPQIDPEAESATTAEAMPAASAERVERLFSEYGCTGCHTFHGERLVGPPLDASFGALRRFTDGTEGVVDRAYYIRSLYEPNAQVVEGYRDEMPSYEGMLDEAAAEDIANYLATLR